MIYLPADLRNELAGFFIGEVYMIVAGDSILKVWQDGFHHLVEAISIVPKERNLDTYEIEKVVLQILHPLEDLDQLLAFEKERGNDFGDSTH